jgi:hypothetical protein
MAAEYETRVAQDDSLRYINRSPRVSSGDNLIAIIESGVATDSWKDNGGATGILRDFAGHLLVAQSPTSHEQIAALMDDIQSAGQGGQPPPPDPAPAILNASVGDLNFAGAPLGNVITLLAERSKAQVLVNWKSLEAAGLTMDAPVSVRLVGATFGTALGSVLELAGGGQIKLAFSIDDNGIVHVSTADDLRRDAVTRVYNIRDLIDIYLTYRRTHGELRMSADDAVNQITQTIENSVEPDSWRDNGGSVGNIHEFAGLLIITTGTESHRRIKALLDQLRTEPLSVTPRE